jgi:hypothetical protein
MLLSNSEIEKLEKKLIRCVIRVILRQPKSFIRMRRKEAQEELVLYLLLVMTKIQNCIPMSLIAYLLKKGGVRSATIIEL